MAASICELKPETAAFQDMAMDEASKHQDDHLNYASPFINDSYLVYGLMVATLIALLVALVMSFFEEYLEDMEHKRLRSQLAQEYDVSNNLLESPDEDKTDDTATQTTPTTATTTDESVPSLGNVSEESLFLTPAEAATNPFVEDLPASRLITGRRPRKSLEKRLKRKKVRLMALENEGVDMGSESEPRPAATNNESEI